MYVCLCVSCSSPTKRVSFLFNCVFLGLWKNAQVVGVNPCTYICIKCPFVLVSPGENLVPEPQSQGEEADQEEAGSVWRQRRFCAQRPGISEPSAGAGLSQPLRHPRLSVPSPGNEHLAIYQEYTAGDSDSVKQLTCGRPDHRTQ